MSVLMIKALGEMEVELELDVNGIRGKEMVGVRQHIELAKALLPLL